MTPNQFSLIHYLFLFLLIISGTHFVFSQQSNQTGLNNKSNRSQIQNSNLVGSKIDAAYEYKNENEDDSHIGISEEIEVFSSINQGEIFAINTINIYHSLFSTYRRFASPWNTFLDPYDMSLAIKYLNGDSSFRAGDQGFGFMILIDFDPYQ